MISQLDDFSEWIHAKRQKIKISYSSLPVPIDWQGQLLWRLRICPFRLRLPGPMHSEDWHLRDWSFNLLVWHLSNTAVQETFTQVKRPNHGLLGVKVDRVQDGQVLWPQLVRKNLRDNLERTLLSGQLVVQFMIKTVIYVPFYPPHGPKGFIVFEVFFFPPVAWDPCSLLGLSVVSVAWHE